MQNKIKWAATLLLSALPLLAQAGHPAPPAAFVPPSEDVMPGGKYGALVKQGRDIFNNTPKFAARYSGNGLSCASCHLDGGRKADAIPMWGAAGMYPQFQAREQQVITLSQRIQGCFLSSMHGFVPPRDSQTMLALETYISWIGTGAPMQTKLPGAQLPVLPDTGRQPDPMHGKTVYADKCAACHQANGKGVMGSDGKYTFPPLWGSDSFAQGAGMGRQPMLARFVWANMPFGAEKSLSVQDANDVAAWIALQWRQPDPRKGVLGWLP